VPLLAHPTLVDPPVLPIITDYSGTAPVITAGRVPLFPVNDALRRRQEFDGSTRASLKPYGRAWHMYAEFCAHRGLGMLEVADTEFRGFIHAIRGNPLVGLDGTSVTIAARRDRAADHAVSLLYSIAEDIQASEDCTFPWCRYRVTRVEGRSLGPLGPCRPDARPRMRRVHKVKWAERQKVGLPDDQFAMLISACHDRWADVIATGDRAFAEDPEDLRGALYWRNLGLLLLARYGGARRSEAPAANLQDIDTANDLMKLATKGHRHGDEDPLMDVPLLGVVRAVLFTYATRYRPVTADEPDALFLSHERSSYGRRISDETIRKVVDTLRRVLDPPWNRELAPHLLRHSWGYDVQLTTKSDLAVQVAMRHRSTASARPYRANALMWAKEIIAAGSPLLEAMFCKAGVPLPGQSQ